MKTLIIVLVATLAGAGLGAPSANAKDGAGDAPPRRSAEAKKKWTIEDAQAFAKSVAAKGAADLPKYGDPQSPVKKAVESVDDICTGADIRTQVANISKACFVFGAVTKKYSDAIAVGNDYSTEVMYLVCASVQTGSLAVGALPKLVATLDQNAPNYQAKLAEVEKAKAQASQQLVGLCMALAVRDALSDDVRAVGSKYLLKYGTVIAANATEAAKADLKARCRELLASEQNADIKRQLSKFLSSLGE